MRRWLASTTVAFGAFVSSAAAQVRPQPGIGDPRFQTIEYRAEQVVTLEVATGYQLALEFAPDEQIESVAVGDSSAWTIATTKRANHLFIKPVQDGTSTNMTVVTDTRTYLFDLQPPPGPSSLMAYTVRFTYPKAVVTEVSGTSSTQSVVEARYSVSGSPRLRPSEIGDDGVKTYIRWPADVALPAIYAVDANGREALVNGMMRNGIYEIDGVSRRLMFRIDDQTAKAVRQRSRKVR